MLYSFQVHTYALTPALTQRYTHAYTKCTCEYFSSSSFACTRRAKCEGNYVCIACVGITTTCDFPSSLNQAVRYMVINNTYINTWVGKRVFFQVISLKTCTAQENNLVQLDSIKQTSHNKQIGDNMSGMFTHFCKQLISYTE